MQSLPERDGRGWRCLHHLQFAVHAFVLVMWLATTLTTHASPTPDSTSGTGSNDPATITIPAPPSVIITKINQTGSGRGTFYPGWTVQTNGSLIAGQLPTTALGDFSKEVAGRNVACLTTSNDLGLTRIPGTSGYTTSTSYVTCGNNHGAGSNIIYTLTGAANGYDLTNITVYGGWADSGRDQQAYTVYYSTVADPNNFFPMAVVNFNPLIFGSNQDATRVTLTSSNGVLAANVASVKFDFTSPGSENGYCGYAAITLFGTASAMPPSTSNTALLKGRYSMTMNVGRPLTAGASNAEDISKIEPYNNPTNGLGSWIWAVKVSDNQTIRLWKSFEIPPATRVSRARLCLTADNEFTVFLDGRELGHGADYPELFVFDLAPLLRPGRHVLAVKAFNSYSYAGMILGLQIDLADGRHIEVKSDESWRVIPEGVKDWQTITQPATDWPNAVIEAPLGGGPWHPWPQNIDRMPTLYPIKVFFWQTVWFQVTLLAICGIAVMTSLWLVARLALHRKEQWLLKRERARIARDIHDDLGARITQLVLHGEVAQSDLPADSGMRSQLGTICHDARDVLSVLDEILWAVNPKRDTVGHFTTYIGNYVEQFLKSTPIQYFLDMDGEAPFLELNLPLRRGLLMVIKEALHNAVKHSEATELWLQIRCEHARLKVVLQDNGKGFDPATADQKRSGLLNMAQRMAELGGTCVIDSQPGKGCKIEISVPLKQSRWRFWGQAEELEKPGTTRKP